MQSHKARESRRHPGHPLSETQLHFVASSHSLQIPSNRFRSDIAIAATEARLVSLSQTLSVARGLQTFPPFPFESRPQPQPQPAFPFRFLSPSFPG